MGPDRNFYLILCLLSSINFLSLAQDNRAPDPNNHFINPPLPGNQSNVNATVYWENQNWTVGTPANSVWNWVTNRSNLSITLQQEGNSKLVQSHMILDCPRASEIDNIYWDGKIGPIDLAIGNIAFLAAWDCDTDNSPLFFSHYINLTEPETVSSSTGSETTASSTKTTPPADTNAASSTKRGAGAATSANDGNHGDSSNTAALAGGIGGGIGGSIVVCAVAALILWHRRGKKKDKQRAEDATTATAAGNSQSSQYPSGISPHAGSHLGFVNGLYQDSPIPSTRSELPAVEAVGTGIQRDEPFMPKYGLDSSTSNSHSRC